MIDQTDFNPIEENWISTAGSQTLLAEQIVKKIGLKYNLKDSITLNNN